MEKDGGLGPLGLDPCWVESESVEFPPSGKAVPKMPQKSCTWMTLVYPPPRMPVTNEGYYEGLGWDSLLEMQ